MRRRVFCSAYRVSATSLRPHNPKIPRLKVIYRMFYDELHVLRERVSVSIVNLIHVCRKFSLLKVILRIYSLSTCSSRDILYSLECDNVEKKFPPLWPYKQVA